MSSDQTPPRQQKIDRAVALGFDPANPSTPGIVATGRGALARRIVDLAFEHGTKVREDADLVEILQTLKIGDQIPAVAFAAVAEILAHVYRWEADRQATEAATAEWGETAPAAAG